MKLTSRDAVGCLLQASAATGSIRCWEGVWARWTMALFAALPACNLRGRHDGSNGSPPPATATATDSQTSTATGPEETGTQTGSGTSSATGTSADGSAGAPPTPEQAASRAAPDVSPRVFPISLPEVSLGACETLVVNGSRQFAFESLVAGPGGMMMPPAFDKVRIANGSARVFAHLSVANKLYVFNGNATPLVILPADSATFYSAASGRAFVSMQMRPDDGRSMAFHECDAPQPAWKFGRELPGQTLDPVAGHVVGVNAVDLTPDGRFIVMAARVAPLRNFVPTAAVGVIYLFRRDQPLPIARWDLPIPSSGRVNLPVAVAVTPDAGAFAAAWAGDDSAGTVFYYGDLSGRVVMFETPRAGTTAGGGSGKTSGLVRLSADGGRMLAVSGSDNSVHFLEPRKSAQPAWSYHFDPDRPGALGATLAADGHRAVVFYPDDGTGGDPAGSHAGRVVAFDPAPTCPNPCPGIVLTSTAMPNGGRRWIVEGPPPSDPSGDALIAVASRFPANHDAAAATEDGRFTLAPAIGMTAFINQIGGVYEAWMYRTGEMAKTVAVAPDGSGFVQATTRGLRTDRVLPRVRILIDTPLTWIKPDVTIPPGTPTPDEALDVKVFRFVPGDQRRFRERFRFYRADVAFMLPDPTAFVGDEDDHVIETIERNFEQLEVRRMKPTSTIWDAIMPYQLLMLEVTWRDDVGVVFARDAAPFVHLNPAAHP